ncbi:Por secretion system C-terminal sorting domain-containing protein [Catalinimonas alkaloidigena]|uniref:Por secretion system C-terminal sorting domain-containing protein n=1 Tax=Catalinimonas alkaloidigena TaxID=1075417 RepID=A0A1G9B4V1_9BACT|nr:T9SS type A sorting domain-containing protein [Catalinimonas alkaloidigena]SDK34586.1 Por secretion system C-terminal sorting domain-containing protein [Catalinimonas alkaloidigena]
MFKLLPTSLLWSVLLTSLAAQNPIMITGEASAVLDAYDVAIDSEENRIIVGALQHQGNHDFDPSAAVVSLPVDENLPSGTVTGFVASYRKGGQLNYAFHISDQEIEPSVSNFQVETDKANNLYVLGAFTGKADFDPSEGVFELQASTVYEMRLFLASYDQAGNFRFALAFPFPDNLFGASFSNHNLVNRLVQVDQDGNSYLLLAPIVDGFDFDPGPDEFTIPFGLYVLSYDQNGNFRFGYQVPNNTKAIGCNPDGSHYITGTLLESIDASFDFDPSPATYVLDNVDSSSFFFAAYNQQGEFQLVKDLKGPNALPVMISGNRTGDIFIAGKMSGIVDFDPSSEVYAVEVSEFEPDESGDLFMARYSATGELLMAQAVQDKVGALCFESITDMEVDAEGNLYLTGVLEGGVVDFDPSSESLDLQGRPINARGGDLFVASYNSEGKVLFAYSVANSRILDNYSSIALEADCPIYTLTGALAEKNLTLELAPGDHRLEINTGSHGSSIYIASLLNPALAAGNCTVTSSPEYSAFSLPQLYPNPTSGTLRVRWPSPSIHGEIHVIDLQGKVVYHQTYRGEEASLDLSHLKSGLYFLKIGQYMLKFSKQ